MATTPQQVITNALVVLGVLFPGQSPSASISNDAFTRLNNMLASWSIERLMVYGILTSVYDLVSGTNAYTIGTGATFNGARPNSIVRANIITPSLSLRSPLKLVDVDEWSQIFDQSAMSTVPTVLYDDYEYPNSTLKFWPTPNSSSTTVELFTWQALESFVTLADSFDMPSGYEQAITYNLAEVLAMVYGRSMSQEAMDVAQYSKANLKGVNAPPTHISGMGEEAIARAQVQQQIGGMPTDANPPLRR
jgi:hypothetical protein